MPVSEAVRREVFADGEPGRNSQVFSRLLSRTETAIPVALVRYDHAIQAARERAAAYGTAAGVRVADEPRHVLVLVVRGRVELPIFRYSGWRTIRTLPLTERKSSPRPYPWTIYGPSSATYRDLRS